MTVEKKIFSKYAGSHMADIIQEFPFVNVCGEKKTIVSKVLSATLKNIERIVDEAVKIRQSIKYCVDGEGNILSDIEQIKTNLENIETSSLPLLPSESYSDSDSESSDSETPKKKRAICKKLLSGHEVSIVTHLMWELRKAHLSLRENDGNDRQKRFIMKFLELCTYNLNDLVSTTNKPNQVLNIQVTALHEEYSTYSDVYGVADAALKVEHKYCVLAEGKSK